MNKKKTSNKINSEKYYLINHRPLIQIRFDSNYNLIKEYIENNNIVLNNLCNYHSNIKNLYSLIRNCPLDLLQKYSNKITNINNNNLDPRYNFTTILWL